MEGGELLELINQNKKLKLNDIRQILKGIIIAIKHMNELNIMHRDLKPENILFKYNNDYSSVVIADFGIAT